MKKALVLLSGGLDSTTALYVAKEQGFNELYAITFEYGQKHDKEIKAAKAVAKAAGVKEHKFVKIMLNQWDGCSLTDEKMDIHDGDINRTTIPDTYVPARNMVFLSVAASYADALDITDIFIGVSEVDYSGDVDCREEFIRSMEPRNCSRCREKTKNHPSRSLHAHDQGRRGASGESFRS